MEFYDFMKSAALALFWDLNARNHEVTLLKIKHIRLKEKYGEGEIPYAFIIIFFLVLSLRFS